MNCLDCFKPLSLAIAILGFANIASADEAVFDGLLRDFLSAESLTGGVLLVAHGDERIIVADGLADKSTGAPVTANSRFYVASSGKMVVAAAILAYVETGEIELDQAVWPYIRAIPGIERLENSDQMPLRQLLNHTSGIADYLDEDFIDASAKTPSKRWTAAEALAFAYTYPASAKPGAVFEYNNANYVLLGHILGELGGSLPAALEAKVFGPAGMTKTSVGGPSDTSDLVHGYQDGADKAAQAWASILGDGPLVMPVEDMGKFIFALFRDKKIIGDALLKTMLTGSNVDDSYGLGMGLDGDDYGTWYGHSGGYDGYEADVRYYPDEDLVLATAVNGNQESEASLLEEAAAAYFEDK